MFGQTGSGKTFTMKTISERVAEDIFKKLPANQSVHVIYIEIGGKGVMDVLNSGNLIKLLQGKGGFAKLKGVSEHPVFDAEELKLLMKKVRMYHFASL